MSFDEAFAVIQGGDSDRVNERLCIEATGFSQAEFARREAEAESEDVAWDELHRSHGDDWSLRDYGLCSVCL